MVNGLTVFQFAFLLSSSLVILLFFFGALEVASIQEKIKKEFMKKPSQNKKEDLFLLDKISEMQIKILNDEKIFRIEQFQKRIQTQEDAFTYSNKLNVYKDLVDNWVRLGDFSRLKGITQVYIDILEMVGIESIEDLKNNDPELIYGKLENLSHIKNPIPTLGMLKYWHRNSIVIMQKKL
jgi:hypothetical protein